MSVTGPAGFLAGGTTAGLKKSGKPDLARLIEEEVRAVNERLEPHERIRRFVLLYKQLDADDDGVACENLP